MNDPEAFDFDEIFASVGVLGHVFSDRIAALDGRTVRMRGHVAPAGHGDSGVLVLTRQPVSPCSDCGGGHDFPDDAVFVFPDAGETQFTPGRAMEVEGVLEHGSLPLPELEATSLVRLRHARLKET